MEPRPEGPQSPYEVYCYHCRTSFPVGTRSCVHCGQRIGERAVPRLQSFPSPLEAADEDVIGEPRIARRLGGLSLWVLLAIGAVISRLCAGQ